MKKKRIVKLEPQTVELFAEVLSKLRPPPPLTVSQWADRYRVLSAESSAEPGRWHTEKAPYQRAIMDAIGDPHVRSVVVMSAAQIGKTDAFILNPLGYYMDYAPCPVMCMQPTLDMGQTLSKDRIAPMIRDTPRLTGLVDTKSRYAGNTVMKKNFPGGHITIVGANSPSSLASRPIKVLLADEIDRYPKSAGTEGDPLDLAKKRQTTFWDYKTVMVSTPTIKGDSRIEDAYLLSTQEEWNVPCPECGAYQPFLWENVKFDKDDLDKGIGYVCRECGCVSYEVHSYKPAYIAPSRLLTLDELTKRGFGEALYPGMDEAQRAARLLADDMNDMENRIARREEWMAAETMIGNGCVMQEYIDGATKGDSLVVKFYDGTSDHTYTASKKWNENGGDFWGDVKAMCRMLSARGLPAKDLILGTDVADYILTDERTRQLLDKNSGIIVGEIRQQLTQYDGVVFMGTLNFGGFMLNVFSVDETYEDETGKSARYFPATAAMVTAPDCGHSQRHYSGAGRCNKRSSCI